MEIEVYAQGKQRKLRRKLRSWLCLGSVFAVSAIIITLGLAVKNPGIVCVGVVVEFGGALAWVVRR